MSIHIVLVEPEIPQNTGNIARTCAVTGASLHLVRPLGFEIDDARLKRAGLDYWHELNIYYHDSFAQLKEKFPDGRFFCATTKADKSYTDFRYRGGDFFVFGKETKGLAREILDQHRESLIRIPMRPVTRSLNLSNSVAIVAYEALRQMDFPSLV
ncbi:tRNA (uridine(34)/cytosine(34)/5-carboxymethylaminomethyluridine(34)-2'-O)-methyltransferase TrmL [Paenactinomyces guangxiensis]|uniref:Putative tRNA (cytidine(34)-2'-O)-methyltransferase n=1 Tax=Paenactinomyces guangxiensis TaxID=1490290 RepID=A0A7W1WP96_9BACL|nr:tRNA (uridine(34)/cytosine(34)/5-carboxymethylaminomethyluridine(34)-2'-O)-methyltransferase TrmL [Paenactinomyces guangxiensis]MBA4493424.1 tRNA (uridine(34)/cytosine(34)/5-carboxymethylaminomethyluridine(34)-2'-O)-methyltransferase TrmL [Paenactinomyces guangxiensis]MBH8590515.1 tRNA (uridine(34)/cytosine(34)/5-carboxymethylaminomethyluridine(34)-2'-O)-methyltransferase TrmL [Paenactinomyces guangxiensis]